MLVFRVLPTTNPAAFSSSVLIRLERKGVKAFWVNVPKCACVDEKRF